MTILALQNQQKSFHEQAHKFLENNPDIEKFEMLQPCLNGPLRGKWLTRDGLKRLATEGIRLPLSTPLLDIWGNDVPLIGRALEIGDPDGLCFGIPNTLSRIPWYQTPSAQVLVSMHEPQTNRPSIHDPRHLLSSMASKAKADNLTPVTATELEFYLYDPKNKRNNTLLAPKIPGQHNRLHHSQVYDMDILAQFEPLLQEISNICREQNIPADTVIAEFGPGQFEINLNHVDDILTAADHSILFKRIIRQIARKHGLDATFMAKPYPEYTGNGFHVHMSMLDQNQHNIFDNTKDTANPSLQHAIGGMLQTAKDLQVIFAPHANSYRRFQPGSYAPVTPCWGYDHRAAAIRVPETSGKAARFEHRIAGADTNPYLLLAGILAGTIEGFKDRTNPDPAIQSLEDLNNHTPLTGNWQQAIIQFSQSTFITDSFGKEFQEIYTLSRQAEYNIFQKTVTDMEYKSYLDRV